MNDSILARKLRPRNLDDLVGQEEIVQEIRNQFASGRLPRAYLLSGESGSGKTTLARILALLLQGELNRTLTEKDWEMFPVYDIRDMNAADANGVEAMRALIADTRMLPAHSKYRVYILNEAHKLTPQAQEALLVPTEDADYTIWFFPTTEPAALKDTLRRRCVTYKMKPLSKEAMANLLSRIANSEGITADTGRLAEMLLAAGVTSPGKAVMALEKVASGSTLEKAIDHITNELNSRELCRGLLKGQWAGFQEAFATYTNAEIIDLRYHLLRWLNKAVIAGNGRSLQAAEAIALLSQGAPVDPPALVPWIIARVYLVVNHASVKQGVKAA